MRLFLIAAGASGIGKDLFTKRVKLALEAEGIEVGYVSMDWYYKPEKDRSSDCQSYDEPKAYDLDLYYQHLEQLNNGETINSPQYSMKTSDRLLETIEVNPDNVQVIIVEGILALHEADNLPVDHKIKVFITTDSYTAIIPQRAVRDVKDNRVSRAEETKERELKTVRDGYFKYILPSKIHADLIFTNNPVGSHQLPHLQLDEAIHNELMELITDKLDQISSPFRNTFG